MNVQSTINHLEASLREELGVQADSLAWVSSMEESLQQNDSQSFEEKTQRGSDLCRKASRCAARRVELLAELARSWGVAPGTLTLGSVVRRLPGTGEQLNLLRKELRLAVADVMKRQRRLTALIRMHARINEGVMQVIVGCESPEEINRGGSLVNAEA